SRQCEPSEKRNAPPAGVSYIGDTYLLSLMCATVGRARTIPICSQQVTSGAALRALSTTAAHHIIVCAERISLKGLIAVWALRSAASRALYTHHSAALAIGSHSCTRRTIGVPASSTSFAKGAPVEPRCPATVQYPVTKTALACEAGTTRAIC